MDWKKYYDEKNCVLYIPYVFNDLLVNLPHSIKIIEFDFESIFDQKVDNLPKSLTKLIIGRYFNKPVDNLACDLTKLTLGCYFDQKIDNLPSTLIELTLGYSFNQNVDKLPSTLTHLFFHFYARFDKNVDNLPPNLKCLAFGTEFNQNVDNLPKSLIHLTFGDNFNKNVDNLPKSLMYLAFGDGFNQSIGKLPDNFTTIIISPRRDIFSKEHCILLRSIKLIDNFISNKINTVELRNENIYTHNEIIDNLPLNIKQIKIYATKKLHLIKKIPFGCRIFDGSGKELFLQ